MASLLGLLLLTGLSTTTIAGHSILDTDNSIQSCVYSFTVPQSDHQCPPGSHECSDSHVTDLKQTIESHFSEIASQIKSLTMLLTEPHEPPAVEAETAGGFSQKSGTHYTRWGHSACPSTAELIYSGFAGKSHYSQGGGVDYQCLPKYPDFAEGAATGYQSKSYIYGVEYEREHSPVIPSDSNDDDAPCAVCHVSNRGEQLMIPAKRNCPTGWTLEYEGLLMAQHHTHKGSTFACVDKVMEPVPGGHTSQNGGLFYAVEPICGALPCPPYQDGIELPCVVCTL